MAEPTTPERPPITLYSHDKRLRFSTPTSAEDEQISILRSDPLSRRYLRFMGLITITEVAQHRISRGKDPRILDLNVFIDATGELVGMTGIFNINDLQKSCEAGILVSPKFQGMGMGTTILYTLLRHVFEERGFHRTTFETGEDNLPMRGWLEKVAGARCEATRVDAWTDSEGGWTTVKGYAILESEWRDHVRLALEKKIEIVGE